MDAGPRDANQFAEQEYTRVCFSDVSLKDLLDTKAKCVLTPHATAAPVIADLLCSCLANKRPFSLTRVGDGEGNALRILRPITHDIQWTTFIERFSNHAHCEFTRVEAIDVCSAMREAILASDVVGFRSVDDSVNGPELEIVGRHLRSGNLTGALGILYAREFLGDVLASEHFADRTVTSAWIHLALIPYLRQIMGAARGVAVVTGHPQLEARFRAELGGRLVDFIRIPPQGFVAEEPSRSHLRGYYRDALSRLHGLDLAGCAVLVGAGILGKAYCHAGRLNGAVAIDLGSAFDLLVGQPSRPAHRSFNYGKDVLS